MGHDPQSDRSPRGGPGMILVAGFEPFGGLTRNTSGEVAQALVGEGVEAAVLPVDYARIGPEITRLLERPWEAVLLLGLAVGQSRIGLEKVAINYRDPHRTDNAGNAPGRPEVVPGGPDAYFTTLPVAAMNAALGGAALPVGISLTAGAYLCNASFYLARHALDGGGTPCGFVHLPPTPDLACAAEPLPFDEQLRAVRILVDTLRA